MRLMRWPLLAAAIPICVVGLILPYRARVAYARGLARAAHAPFLLFGWAARTLLRALAESPVAPHG